MSNGGMFTIFRISQSGLNKQMKKLEVTAENIANADKSAAPGEEIYKRKVVAEEEITANPPKQFSKELNLQMRRGNRKHLSQSSPRRSNFNKQNNENETKIIKVDEPKLVYNPGHPLADDNGYVRVSNVNMVEEMVNMMSASRAYDANLSAIEAAKNMADKAMKI